MGRVSRGNQNVKMTTPNLASSKDLASAPLEATTLRRCLAVAAIGAALLLYEISITLITSATLYYHSVFLVLALAMLGIAAPGVWFTTRPPGERTLPRVLLISAATIPLSIVAIFHIGRLLAIGEDDTAWGLPVLTMASLVVPMLSLGAALCLMLMRAPGRAVGTIYGSDLLGSTLGAVVAIPAMGVLSTPSLVALSGLLPTAAVFLIDPRSRRFALLVGLVICVSVAWGEPYQLRYNRVDVEDRDPLFERWTATARITVVPAVADGGACDVAGWGWGTRHQPVLREQLFILQEGGAGTPMIRMEEWPTDVTYLLDDVTSAGLQVVRPARVCVIGAGGGRDILAALAAGATDIDAVELNPAIYEAVSQRFASFSGDPYSLPGVNGVVSEGRSFLTRSPGEYDTITVSLVDSWAATAAGAYSLSENYLYTLEALRLYWSRLSSRGVVSIARWFTPVRQFETTRLALMAVEALSREGVETPREHIAVISGSYVASVLISRVPFTKERVDTLTQVASERGFLVHWPIAALTMGSEVTEALTSNPPPDDMAGHDLSPTTDDRPFFFHSVSIFDWGSESVDFNDRAIGMLRTVLVLTTLLVLGLVLLPFVLRRGTGAVSAAGTVYFASIGFAFMFVELSTIQRFILYLGHPSYATTAVIASLLAGAGLGAMAAARFPRPVVSTGIALIPVAVAVMVVTSEVMLEQTLGLALDRRLALTIMALAPTGFFLGLAFPAGMFTFEGRSRAWHWAINGAASVLGSVLSLVLAMRFGFAAVTWLGVVAYLMALLAWRRAPTAKA